MAPQAAMSARWLVTGISAWRQLEVGLGLQFPSADA